MQCPNCGRVLSGTEKFCPGCGAALSSGEQAAPVALEARKRSGRNGLLVGLGCLLLAALIGLGVWFLTRRNSENALLQAAERSLGELKAYVEDLPNLNKILTNVEQLQQTKSLHSELKIAQDSLYDGREEPGMHLQLSADYVEGCSGFTGRFGASDDAADSLEFFAYGDRDQLQLSIPALTGEKEVFALPMKDLPKQWNASALSELLQLTMPEEAAREEDEVQDLDASMERLFGQDWVQLRDSVKAVKYEAEPHFAGSGTTYTLDYDRDALRRICEKAGDSEELDSESIPSMMGQLRELPAKMLTSLLCDLYGKLKDMQFYVEDGKLIGMYLEINGEEGEEQRAELRLEGQGNIWERLTVKSSVRDEDHTESKTVELALKKEDDQLRLDVNTQEQDTRDEYQHESFLFRLVYNDADGTVAVYSDGEPVEDAPKLRLQAVEGGFRLLMERSEDWGEGYGDSMHMELIVNNQAASVAPLSQTPTELLKLSKEELQALMQRIVPNLQKLFNFGS